MKSSSFRAALVVSAVLVVAVAGVLTVAYVTFPLWAQTGPGTRLIIGLAESLSGYEIEVARITAGPGPLIEARDVRVGQKGATAFLSAGRLAVSLPARALLAGRVGAVGVSRFTFSSQQLGKGRGELPSRPPFEELLIEDGTAELRLGETAHVLSIERGLVVAAEDGRVSLSGSGRLLGVHVEWTGEIGPGWRDVGVEVTARAASIDEVVAALPVPSSFAESVHLIGAVSGKVFFERGLGDLLKVSLNIRVEPSGPREGIALAAKVAFSPRPESLAGSLVLHDLALVTPQLAMTIAEASADFEVRAGEEETAVRVDRLIVRNGTGHDPDYRHGVEGITLAGRGVVLHTKRPGRVGLEGSVTIDGGEVLWDRFYGSFSDHPTKLSVVGEAVVVAENENDPNEDDADGTGVRGRLDLGQAAARSRVEIRQATVRAADLGSATLTASIDQRRGRAAGEVRFDVPDVAGLYQLLVREPYADLYPSLSDLSASGGMMGELAGKIGPAGIEDMHGRIRLTSVTLRSADGRWLLSDVSAGVPVALTTTGDRRVPDVGRLRVGRAVLAGIDVTGFDLLVEVRPNEVDGQAPIELGVLGGTLRLSGLRARDLASENRSLRVGVAASGIDLQRLGAAWSVSGLSGRLDGDLREVLVHHSMVETDGTLVAEVLGGRVTLTNIAVTRLLSSVAALHLDADLAEIDLGQATDALGVGRVSGIATGKVRDLEIVGGEPVRFDARLETVARRGVRQRISVKAIEQLSILGGSGSSPVTRGILSFFDEYRYSKMGVRCSLRNDRFILRGVERLKEKDFLVVGTFMPPTVNVISHNQVIAFKDMVRRLKRIAAVGEGEPQSR